MALAALGHLLQSSLAWIDSEISQLVGALGQLFTDLVPPQAQPFVMFIGAFVAVRIIWEILRTILRILYGGIEGALRLLGRAANERSGSRGQASAVLAIAVTALERTCDRTGVRRLIESGEEFEEFDSSGSPSDDDRVSKARGEPLLQFIETDLTHLRVSGVMPVMARRGTAALILILATVILVPPLLLWLTVKRNFLVLIVALVLCLWFYDQIPYVWSAFTSFVVNLGLTIPQASTVIATGTLIVIIYAALNSDVRARAEANKNASVECRAALLRLSDDLLELADDLIEVRESALSNIRIFPTEEEIERFTGRDDLVWRGATIVPEDVSRIPPSVSRFYRRSDLFDRIAHKLEIDVTAPFGKGYPRTRAADRALADAEIRADAILAELSSLRKSGAILKLDRVLTSLGEEYLLEMAEKRFKLPEMRELLDRDSVPWWRGTFTTESFELEFLEHRFVELMLGDVNSSDGTLLGATDLLTIEVRKTQQGMLDAVWESGLIAAQLLWIATFVNASLQPGAIERTRQAFGK